MWWESVIFSNLSLNFVTRTAFPAKSLITSVSTIEVAADGTGVLFGMLILYELFMAELLGGAESGGFWKLNRYITYANSATVTVPAISMSIVRIF